jgi:hypothetical protein
MADEPKDMLAREIDEELRRERLLKIWDQYGTYILAAAVLIVVGVGGVKYHQYSQQQASEEASVKYIIALRDFAIGHAADAQKNLEAFIPAAPAGYATLARLRLAAHDRSAGNTDAALAAYDEIAGDSSVDPILADYARLQAGAMKLDAHAFTEAKNRLTPLAADRSPWRFSARELLGITAYKAGFPAEARNHLQRLLTDRLTPPGIAERAKVMMSVLAEAEQAKKAPTATEKSEVPSKSETAGAKKNAAGGNGKNK